MKVIKTMIRQVDVTGDIRVEATHVFPR